MMRGWFVGLAVALLAGGAAPAAGPGSPARPLKVENVTLRVLNRVFPDFREEDTVRMREEFRVGDSQYTAKVVEFVPDFSLDLKNHRVVSRSNEPKNPAVRVIVKEKGVPRDTSWAFLNFAPHFATKNILGFQILRIEFLGRPPLVAPDTAAAHGAGARP